MNKTIKLSLSILLVWTVLIAIGGAIFYQINLKTDKSVSFLKQAILQEAVAHFDNMVDTRKWNASHGGVYVKQHNNLQPNPYLRDNILKTDKNETLIKINPAWMTRQISEIANVDNRYYYKITSLKPVNKNNKADEFESEALSYFNENKDVEHYYSFPSEYSTIDRFDFMGRLKVTQKCMQCHGYQGYKLGDIRGGIRVSIPTEIYNTTLIKILNDSSIDRYVTIIFILFLGFIISIYLIKNARHLEKQKLQNEVILAQSRYVAMGEVTSMLAHQWRQPISSISMHVNNALVDIELGGDSKEIVENLEKISLETQALSKIISSFNDLFELGSQNNEVIVSEVIDKVLSVFEVDFQSYGIIVEKDYTNEVKLSLSSQGLFQVLWNILLNAKDVLVLRNINLPKIRIELNENEKEVIIVVSDNAGGIMGSNCEKVFEPYYSTDKNLNGKGLGLFTSRTIVERNLNGEIDVKNSGEGAQFCIHLKKSNV